MLVAGGIVLFVVYVHNTSNTTSTQITVVWQTPTTAFTKQEQQDIQNSLKSELLATSPQGFSGFSFNIVSVKRQGVWGTLNAEAYVSGKATPLATEPLFAITHQQSGIWRVWTEKSPHFCDQLKQIPDTFMSSTDKHYFLGCFQ